MSFLAVLYVLLHGHPMPPLSGVFESIAMEPYEAGVNDCSNKAGRYARALLNKGIQAEVIFVLPPGSENSTYHAVVFTQGLYCDPTTGKVKKTLEEFGTRVTSVDRYHLNRDEEFT